MPNSQLIDAPKKCKACDCTRHAKRICLIKRRKNGEINRGICVVPSAIAVAGHDAESVCACAKIGVRRFPVRPRFTPAPVNAVQSVTITHALRITETQPHVAKGRSPCARWKV